MRMRWLAAVAAVVTAPSLIAAQFEPLDVGIPEPSPEAEETKPSGGGEEKGLPIFWRDPPKRDPTKPFYQLKPVTTPDDPMEGWTQVRDKTQVPDEYCLDETLTVSPCDANFMSFASYWDMFLPTFPDTTKTDKNVLYTGKLTPAGLLKFSTDAGQFIFFTKDGSKYIGLDEKTMQFVYVTKDKASKFDMFVRKEKDAILLATGENFVQMNADGMTATLFITHDCFLLPPKTTSDPTDEEFVGTIDKFDSSTLGLRAGALSKGAKSVARWMAYDLALVKPLQDVETATYAKFSMLEAKKVDEKSLKVLFTKAFELIADKMLLEYSKFGKKQPLSQEIQIHELDQIETTDPSVWVNVANHFVEDSRTVNLKLSHHFGAMVFANAKYKERQVSESRLSDKDEKAELWQVAYFRSSCALAWDTPGLTLQQKLDRVHVLDATSPVEDEKNLQSYWFTPLLKDPRSKADAGILSDPLSPLNTSRLLIELGLMKLLDPAFLADNSDVGESIAKPLFDQLDVLLKSDSGMDLDGVYRLVKDNSTRNAMELVDNVCSARLLDINVCVLPQIFRQASIFSMYDRNITSPNVITNLKNAAAIDQVRYFKLIRSDRTNARLNQALVQVKGDYVTAAKTFTDGLNEIIEDSVVEQALAASQQLSSTTTALAKFAQQSAEFHVAGVDGDLTRKMNTIDAASKQAADAKDAFVENLESIGTIAKIRATADAFVAVVKMAFDTFEMAKSFGKGGGGVMGAIAGAGALATQLETTIQAITTADDTFELVRYTKALTKEFTELLAKMQQALPAIQAVRVASQPLITGQKLTNAQLAQHSQQFLEALRGYKAPVTVAELNSIQVRFRGVAEKLCLVGKIPTITECIDLPGQNMLIFTNLLENVRLGEEVMQLLMDMCTEAVNARTQAVLVEKVEANKAAAANLDDLKTKWGTDAKKKQTWWFRWRKQQQYLMAVATAASIQQEVYLLSAIADWCSHVTYRRGGVPTTACEAVFSGELIEDTTMDALIDDSGNEEAPDIEHATLEPLIPTQPAFPGDLAYIDLPKLMEGQSVYFKLPSNNATWLAAHRWIQDESELESAVVFITSFKLHLPPRYAHYATEASSTDMTIESRQQSELGPARPGKSFLINPVQFRSDYTLDPEVSGDDGCHVVYEVDKHIPEYCFSADGKPPDKLKTFPSMFAEWSITAKITTDEENPPRIGYSKATTPLMLRAVVTRSKVTVDASARRDRRRALRRLPAKRRSLQERCSGENEYAAFVDGEFECRPCPKGSIKQLGGLYCALDPRPSKDKGGGGSEKKETEPKSEQGDERRLKGA